MAVVRLVGKAEPVTAVRYLLTPLHACCGRVAMDTAISKHRSNTSQAILHQSLTKLEINASDHKTLI